MKRWQLFSAGIFAVLAVMGLALKGTATRLIGEPIPLGNPGFEEGLDRWIVPSAFADHVWTTGNAHSGLKGLQIEGTAGADDPFIYRKATRIQPKATYRLAVWASASAAATGTIKIEFYNSQRRCMGSYASPCRLEDNKWHQLEVTAQADADAVRANIELGVSGGGAVSFDDVSFEQTIGSPELAFSESEGLTFLPGEPLTQVLNLWSKNKMDWTTASAVGVTLNSSNEAKSLTTKLRHLDSNRMAAAVDLPPLDEGSYNLSASIGNILTRSPLPVYVFAQKKPAGLSKNGALQKHGEPFFPIGIYNVNHTPVEYALLAENGFNMIQGRFAGSMEDIRDSLDLAEKFGLAVDVPLYASDKVKDNLQTSLKEIQTFGAHPAVLSWKILDEPDADRHASLRDEVCKAYLELKARQPSQPIELTLSQTDTLGQWTRFCDVVQIDRYPIPGRPLMEVAEFCRAAKAKMQPWQNLTFVVQCGWTADLKTQPTFAQARTMVYLALISGAKGISWYSRQDDGWDLTKSPLWPRMKEVNAEIKALAKPVLLGDPVDGVKCSTSRVSYSAKRFDGKIYLLTSNPDEHPVQASFAIPQGYRVKSVVEIDGRHHNVEANGELKVSLDAVDSRTFILDLGI